MNTYSSYPHILFTTNNNLPALILPIYIPPKSPLFSLTFPRFLSFQTTHKKYLRLPLSLRLRRNPSDSIPPSSVNSWHRQWLYRSGRVVTWSRGRMGNFTRIRWRPLSSDGPSFGRFTWSSLFSCFSPSVSPLPLCPSPPFPASSDPCPAPSRSFSLWCPPLEVIN